MSEDEITITIKRTIDAPAEEVFAAWTDPALLEQWQADIVSFEAFEGGEFRFESHDEEDPAIVHTVTGTVLEFEQDKKLVERWRYAGDGSDLDSSILMVTFNALSPDRTEIVLNERSATHEDPQSRIFSIEAWSAAIEDLAELLE
ncbi:SRPBCC family protein [Pelagibacterium montanilacus]|uniref:SRPBCC family protein n=1 Tax=Pelagibacterium montanilacus TaxID=2185280 RepID=UPI000F8CEF56|nr:SRPBCC domain-containing protein [Pelagibacterium montanilacus]